MAPVPPHERTQADTPDALARGRAAARRGSWQEAFRSLSAADGSDGLGPEDLWLLALSAFLIGRADTYLAALERAHHLHLDRDDPVGAARCAFWLGFHLSGRGEAARGGGWLGRAGRLLERVEGDCPERGYLALATAHQRLGGGDPEATFEAAARAVEIAERFGDRDLLALALHLQGQARIRQGRMDEGLALLDESMVGSATGELSPQVTGLVYCSMIGACRRVFALGRVHEWTAALTEWCRRQPDMVAYGGECRVYRAEIMRLRGDWRDAIEEARRARERLAEGAGPGPASLAFYQQGEAHRLLGEFESAEEAYTRARSLGREPQPGLALLRLARGGADAAAAAIRRAAGETTNRLDRAALLPAFIEIMLAVGEVEEARQACAELEEIAATLEPGVLGVLGAHWRGAVHLAEGDPMAALAPLREALRGWQALDAPYETARVRTLLAHACRALGDADTAALELDAARAAFERLGAAPDLERLDTSTGRRQGRRAHGLTSREMDVLRLVATGRTNRAIAQELFISEKTVARHVSNIFGKLGLSTRAAATAFAYEHDLVEPSA